MDLSTLRTSGMQSGKFSWIHFRPTYTAVVAIILYGTGQAAHTAATQYLGGMSYARARALRGIDGRYRFCCQ